MLLTSHPDEAVYKNRHHFSKEALFSRHSSDIIPIGSPLQVWNLKLKYNLK